MIIFLSVATVGLNGSFMLAYINLSTIRLYITLSFSSVFAFFLGLGNWF